MLLRPILILAVASGAIISCAERTDDPAESNPAPAPGPVSAVGDPVPDSAAIPEPDEPSPARWTADATTAEHEVTGTAVLAEVRTSRNEGFDRFVVEFEDDRIPSYHIQYVDRPIRQCGSGDVVSIDGDGWLAVRLEPADAHTQEGRPTIEQRDVRPELPAIRHARLICDFEAQVEWILGVRSPNRYRVMELRDPARLVVDVRHE